MAGSTEACRKADMVLERLAENSTPGSQAAVLWNNPIDGENVLLSLLI